MTPGQAIAALDKQLKAHSQTVVIRRYGAGASRPKTDLPDVPAFVRAVKPEEFFGNVDSTFSNVSISPTNFTPMWPLVKGDKIVIDGRERNVEAVRPIRLNDVLVRCNLVVAG